MLTPSLLWWDFALSVGTHTCLLLTQFSLWPSISAWDLVSKPTLIPTLCHLRHVWLPGCSCALWFPALGAVSPGSCPAQALCCSSSVLGHTALLLAAAQWLERELWCYIKGSGLGALCQSAGGGGGAWKEEADPSRLPLCVLPAACLTALPEVVAETCLVCTQRWLV